MTPNDTISISVAEMDNKDLYFNDLATAPFPLDNAGKQVPALLGVELAFIPKGAKNIDAAKDFIRYLINPSNLGSYLKQARGRWLPVMPSIVQNDPYWLDPKDPHRGPRCVRASWDQPRHGFTFIIRRTLRLTRSMCLRWRNRM